ncbi:MAG: hypothetical protein B6U97_03625 [Candidatus Altiarchaeales archaeon ex4484_96]|nr:MAG: hypothetical protein B6U97_03625 [Candidatus Altiarchaeales archaeon ex4484_96]
MEKLENIINKGVNDWGKNYVLSMPFILDRLFWYMLQFILGVALGIIIFFMLPSDIIDEPDLFSAFLASGDILSIAGIISALAFVFLVVRMLVGGFLISGATGMSLDVLEKKQTGLSQMIRYGLRYYHKLFAANLLVLLTLLCGEIIIVGAFFGLPYEIGWLARENPMFVLGLIAIMAGLCFSVIYALLVDISFKNVQFALVYSKKGVLDSLKTSINFFKINKLDVFLIWLIVLIIGLFAYSVNFIISVFFGLIPIVGPLIAQLLILVVYLILSFVLDPVSTLWYGRLYVDRKLGFNPANPEKSIEPAYQTPAPDETIKQ